MAMIAMTTSNSIKVKPDGNRDLFFSFGGVGLIISNKEVNKIVQIDVLDSSPDKKSTDVRAFLKWSHQTLALFF